MVFPVRTEKERTYNVNVSSSSKVDTSASWSFSREANIVGRAPTIGHPFRWGIPSGCSWKMARSGYRMAKRTKARRAVPPVKLAMAWVELRLLFGIVGSVNQKEGNGRLGKASLKMITWAPRGKKANKRFCNQKENSIRGVGEKHHCTTKAPYIYHDWQGPIDPWLREKRTLIQDCAHKNAAISMHRVLLITSKEKICTSLP